MYFLRDQFWKKNFESHFEDVFLEGVILKMLSSESKFQKVTLKMYFLKEQFKKEFF